MPKHNKNRDAAGQNISEDAAAITQKIVLMPRAMILACRRPWYSSMKQVLMHIYRDTQRRTQQSKNDANGTDQHTIQEVESVTLEELLVKLMYVVPLPIAGGRGVELDNLDAGRFSRYLQLQPRDGHVFSDLPPNVGDIVARGPKKNVCENRIHQYKKGTRYHSV